MSKNTLRESTSNSSVAPPSARLRATINRIKTPRYAPKPLQTKRPGLSFNSALLLAGPTTKKKPSKNRNPFRQLITSRVAFSGLDYLPKVNANVLRQTVRKLMMPGLGILAADDSVAQLGSKLNAFNLENTDTNRRLYHEMLLGASPGREDWIKTCFSGVLMREDSLLQPGYNGKKLTRLLRDRAVLLGIRYDKGVERLPGSDREYISTGLDGLTEAITRTRLKGAKFGLFRCVFRISELTPSRQAIVENSLILSKFAWTCQSMSIVPIVAAEVLTEGSCYYGQQEARCVLREILSTLVKVMRDHHVYLEGLLIRLAPCRPGLSSKAPRDLKIAACETWKVLNECIPPATGGVLLSRCEDLCTSLFVLNQMQICRIKKPFFVSFCYSRVIQDGVGLLWAGQDINLDKARVELIMRAERCSLAAFGQLQVEQRVIMFEIEENRLTRQ